MRSSGIFAALLVSLSLNLGVARAEPVLGVSGDKFTVNGVPKFLLFVSYFDGLRASNASIEQDFQYFQSNGIDGVRIFPNWWLCAASCGGNRGGDTLMEPPTATLRADRLARLKYVLDRAAHYGLVVDLSFAKETIGPSPLSGGLWTTGTNYGYGITDTAAALAGGAYRHVMFDLQNEVDHTSGGVYDQRVAYLDPGTDGAFLSELNYYLPGPARVVVTSTSQNHDAIRRYNYCGYLPGGCAADDRPTSAVAVHDFRGADWQNQTDDVVNSIRTNVFGSLPTKPIYLQEPMPWQDATPAEETLRVEKFLTAASNAKAAGAAAWTFHTRSGFILSGASMLTNMGGGEEAVIARLRGRVNAATSVTSVHTIRLRAIQSAYYVMAQGGGGSGVTTAPAAAQWETFNLIDLNGGELMHGDWVNLQTYNWNYIAPTNGGGSTTNAIAASPGQQQTVQIFKLEGGSTVIYNTQWIGFRCNSGVWWMVAENGGGPGSVVNWNRTAPGPWETFSIQLMP
jgi:hypothetical protein